MIKKIYYLFKKNGIYKFCKIITIRLIAMIIGFPIALVIIMISPLMRIRLIKLFSFRIGHYALNTELMLCAQDAMLFGKNKQCKTFYYTAPGEPICNMQLHRMWKRVITIFPFSYLCHQIDKYMIMLLGATYKNDPYKNLFETPEGARDQWHYLDNVTQCHIAFTSAEEQTGKELLKQLGIQSGRPFVCLLGRDSAYLKSHLPNNDWSYHDYRDVTINNYNQCAEYLSEMGYYVVRMGKHVAERFETNNPMIIDYANHDLRSDFMDIYLSAHCYFFITPRSGIDAVAQIFRKPLLVTNFPLCDYKALYFLNLFIPKKIINTQNGKYSSFREMYQPIDRKYMMQVLNKNNLKYIENTPDEITEAVKEMLCRLENNWTESSDSRLLQEKFWRDVPEYNNVPYDMINMRIGEKFLQNHLELLN